MNRRLIFTAFLIFILLITLFSLSCNVPELPDEVPPTCIIIYPVGGQAVSGDVKIVIGANDNDELDRINLYIDGDLETTFRKGPYEFVWNTAPIADNQDHSIFAVAYDKSDNAGFSGTTVVRVVSGSLPDTLSPVITLIHPVAGAVVKDTVQVIPQIIDDGQIQKVDYFVDGYLAETVTQSPFIYMWDVTGYLNGSTHAIFARAFDENMNSGYSGVITVTVQSSHILDNTPPSVSIGYPITGSTLTQNTTIVANAFDNIGIANVEFYIDGLYRGNDATEPYEFSWQIDSLSPGSSHSIFAIAYDGAANSATSATVTVTVQPQDNIPPTVLILYPPTGNVFTAGEVVSIAVDAQDNTGIDKVEFYIDGQLLSTDNTAPYQYDWDTTGYGNGLSHSIYVKAYDLAGNTATQLITVTVNP